MPNYSAEFWPVCLVGKPQLASALRLGLLLNQRVLSSYPEVVMDLTCWINLTWNGALLKFRYSLSTGMAKRGEHLQPGTFTQAPWTSHLFKKWFHGYESVSVFKPAALIRLLTRQRHSCDSLLTFQEFCRHLDDTYFRRWGVCLCGVLFTSDIQIILSCLWSCR